MSGAGESLLQEPQQPGPDTIRGQDVRLWGNSRTLALGFAGAGLPGAEQVPRIGDFRRKN